MPTAAQTGRATPSSSEAGTQRTPRLVVVGAGLTAIGVLAMVASGAGYRMALWSLEVAFRELFAGGAALALIGGLLSLGAMASSRVRRRGRAVPVAATSVIVAVVAVGTFAAWMAGAKSAPPIHDITTDTDDPPTFVVLRSAREAAPNGFAYGGPAIAAQQHAVYPDVKPVVLAVPPAEAFRRALIVARSMGWDLASVDSAAYRIEATATTPWYGFKDDIVVRVQPADGGSRVDVRSASRLGESDVGTNAGRVRRYLERLRE
jgi:uncharacterized protein (DUF1499 family)